MYIENSDCGAIGDVQNPHKYTSTPEGTVAATLKGGCDLECDSYYKSYLYGALNASKITEADIDTAISRIFTHFIALGVSTYDEFCIQNDEFTFQMMNLYYKGAGRA